jgi:hypothetical protein
LKFPVLTKLSARYTDHILSARGVIELIEYTTKVAVKIIAEMSKLVLFIDKFLFTVEISTTIGH